ncbi:hypothetical protein HID58_056576 [Brassica napus]|uniref:Uncharacterized protein n=1 Tax=Brassica napus TaxID=3708 RepID=A0ABQ8ANP2_BRANA|nr:hypothetical protein HID58_056576 [Brassica napus]
MKNRIASCEAALPDPELRRRGGEVTEVDKDTFWPIVKVEKGKPLCCSGLEDHYMDCIAYERKIKKETGHVTPYVFTYVRPDDAASVKLSLLCDKKLSWAQKGEVFQTPKSKSFEIQNQQQATDGTQTTKTNSIVCQKCKGKWCGGMFPMQRRWCEFD